MVYLALSSLLARSRAPGPVVARSQRVESNKVWFDDTITVSSGISRVSDHARKHHDDMLWVPFPSQYFVRNAHPSDPNDTRISLSSFCARATRLIERNKPPQLHLRSSNRERRIRRRGSLAGPITWAAQVSLFYLAHVSRQQSPMPVPTPECYHSHQQYGSPCEDSFRGFFLLNTSMATHFAMNRY